VRLICSGCRAMITGQELLTILRADGVSEAKMQALGIDIDPRAPCLHATGCARCRHTGYLGRQAVFEMFEVSEGIRELIVAPTFSADAVHHAARRAGMVSMVENALELVSDDRTSFAEVIRVFGDGVS